MKNKLLFLSLFLIFFVFNSYGQTTIFLEDFEDSSVSYTTSIPEFSDISSSTGYDYFTRTDGSNIGSNTILTNIQGSFYFGAQDIDGEDAILPVNILFDDINISGYTNLEFRIYLAEDDDGVNEDWDAPDYFHINYDIDNSGIFSNLLWIEADIPTGTNSKPYIDTDFDGIGDGTEITDSFVQYTVSIASIGDFLDLSLEFDLNSGDEDIAIDHIEIVGFPASGNQPPIITNITQTPAANVTPTDAVSVSADVTDDDGLTSVTLNWGTNSGSLPNHINMNLGTGDTYTTASDIPAQADGTTVYYEIEAIDNDGTPLTTTSAEQSYMVATPVAVPNIIISEIMQNPDAVGDADGEYFELYNATSNPIDIENWVISDEGSNNFTISGSLMIPANDFIILGKNADSGTNGGITIDYEYPSGFSIGNSDDEIILTDDLDNEVDRVEYDGGSNWPDPTGAAMVYIGLEDEDNNNGHLWREATIAEGLDTDFGSPGSNGVNQFLDNIIVYDNAWSPSAPDATTDNVNVVIKNGTVTLAADTDVRSLTIKSGASLEIETRLTITGDLYNAGSLTFKSTSISATGTLGQLSAEAVIESDNTTIERFIPGKRAFRFLSSPVATTGSINANWQEGQHNTGTTFGDNVNNNIGFGTHITGSTDGSNGFDATVSGNPSLFNFDNTNQTWSDVANTNSENLERGKPYRIYIRGSRAVDLTSNASAADDTRLRMTGTIADATVINVNNLGTTVDDYNLIGNPYQSAINMQLVLSTYTTDLNTIYYYIWDPTVNTRGAYVAIDVDTNTNTIDGGVGSSAANQYLQPNQAFFVQTTGGSPELEFHQLQKVSDNLTATFRPTIVSYQEIAVQLLSTVNNNTFIVDGNKIYFDANFSNQVTAADADKLGNQDENLAIVNGGNYLSIERRALPIEDEEIAFFNNNYRNTNYTLAINLPSLEIEAYIIDDYLQTQTLLQEGANTYNFTVNETITGSIAPNRFKILFGKPLNTSSQNTISLQVYPNPIQGDILNITSSYLKGNTQVEITNLMGQSLYRKDFTQMKSQLTINKLSNLSPGIYILSVESNGKQYTQKIIKQ